MPNYLPHIQAIVDRRPLVQAKGLAAAAGKAILNPKPVPKEERDRRLAICNACLPPDGFYVNGRCLKCGCTVKWKALLEAWHCPISKW